MAARFGSTPETTNYARLCRLVVDVGTEVLRHLVITQLTPVQLGADIVTNRHILRPILNPDQRQRLYGPGTNPGVSQFDISLLYILIRNLCPRIGPPTYGWGKPPPPVVPGQPVPLADEVERIRTSRNTIYGHVTRTAVSTADFGLYWADIDAVLARLDRLWGTQFQQHGQNLKVECMDPEMVQRYMSQFHILCVSDQQTRTRIQAVEGNTLVICIDLSIINNMYADVNYISQDITIMIHGC
jgi:hypothetical protein